MVLRSPTFFSLRVRGNPRWLFPVPPFKHIYEVSDPFQLLDPLFCWVLFYAPSSPFLPSFSRRRHANFLPSPDNSPRFPFPQDSKKSDLPILFLSPVDSPTTQFILNRYRMETFLLLLFFRFLCTAESSFLNLSFEFPPEEKMAVGNRNLPPSVTSRILLFFSPFRVYRHALPPFP